MSAIFNKIFNKAKSIKTKAYSWIICHRYGFDGTTFKCPVNQILTNRGGSNEVKIGSKTQFGKMAVVTAWGKYRSQQFSSLIKIGKRCNFGDYVHITAINRITIGNDVLTGRWVTITDNSHGTGDPEELRIPPAERPLVSKGSVTIEDRVWIGDKATILPGVTIGEGAVIGANSTVTRDVPPNCIAAGNPARVIKRIL